MKFIKGIFCISLDFEKYWGIHDVQNWQDKELELREVNNVIKRLVALFEQRNIHATWAIVGLLQNNGYFDLVDKTKDLNVPYQKSEYSPFPLKSEKYSSIPDEIISAKEEIQIILGSKNQELASHTFSHYYSLEDGQEEADFKRDISLMNELASSLNASFKSLIFPRNQVNYLNICQENDYLAYRGNQKNKLWSNSQYENESILKKGKRYLDAYYNISSTEGTSIKDIEINNGLVNIPASRFLRPFSGKSKLEKKKLARIKSEMEKAAKNDEIYHLWWHPHNFAKNIEENISQLKDIIEWFHELEKEYGFSSLNMGEIAANVKK